MKILAVGGLIAALVYFFHPGTGQFSLVINGQPVAEPLVRFAAIPALLIVMFFTAVLMLLAFFGVGLFIFLAALAFFGWGVFIVAPYFWPVLAIIFLIILLMSFGDNKNSL
ncbi:MAG: hypothetical protein PHG00_06105 [Methylococcales bacterium]|nr:hypothetical protein [Methylococcales bacterium]